MTVEELALSIKKEKELQQQALLDVENITKEDLDEAYQQAIVKKRKEKQKS